MVEVSVQEESVFDDAEYISEIVVDTDEGFRSAADSGTAADIPAENEVRSGDGESDSEQSAETPETTSEAADYSDLMKLLDEWRAEYVSNTDAIILANQQRHSETRHDGYILGAVGVSLIGLVVGLIAGVEFFKIWMKK